MESTTRSTLAAVKEQLLAAANSNVLSTNPAELAATVGVLTEIRNICDGLELKVIHQAEVCEVAKAADASSTTAWLADKQGIDPTRAKKKLTLARMVEQHLPTAGAALCAGEISVDQVHAIAHTITTLPKDAPLGEVDKTLTDHAQTLGPTPLRKLGNHVLELVAPDVAHQILQAQVEREERDADKTAYFHLSQDPDSGMWRFSGRTDKDTGERLHLLVDARSRPVKGADGPDLRTAAARRADAFGQIIELAHNHSTTRHGGNRTQMVVMVNPDTGIGTTLHTGQDLSPELTARIMCEAEVSHLLPDHLMPGHLHLTDPERLFTGKLRRLLELRDRGCAFPGCDRPPGWTHAHHIKAWSKGGPTTLNNGVLLCTHHHRVIHRGDWAIRMALDGKPEFIPPPWIDHHQTPIRNPIHA
ncbi:HNH endonuclease signature motif containing protein [Tenggerimyces flavus]|uniref:DUF222 domain-containing protein n=1 Tax=Tenggerimyces flavus TaxID=1708749 RepID=A0ABV7YMU0_9ACTN|nr:HNH endonuclease signature motif containing protein [Tenggerimyces flavus]MBM7786466.1 hypothetical protein [Tenggerimyces flavus]